MGKAFDDVISENEKYYLYHRKNTSRPTATVLRILFYYRCHDSTQKSSFCRDQQSLKKTATFAIIFPLKLDSESTKQYSAAVRKYPVSDTCLKTAAVEKVGITIMCICPFQEVRVSSSCHFHVLHTLPTFADH